MNRFVLQSRWVKLIPPMIATIMFLVDGNLASALAWLIIVYALWRLETLTARLRKGA